MQTHGLELQLLLKPSLQPNVINLVTNLELQPLLKHITEPKRKT